jgi:ribosome-associated protein
MARIHASDLLDELEFSASRSSGPGGQNVNKVSTKISMRFDVRNSVKLTPEQKEVLLNKWASRLTKEGELLLHAQEKRSQLQNKEEVLVKLENLLVKAFTVKKARKATKPSKAAKRKRIDDKKQRGEKKQWRQKL